VLKTVRTRKPWECRRLAGEFKAAEYWSGGVMQLCGLPPLRDSITPPLCDPAGEDAGAPRQCYLNESNHALAKSKLGSLHPP